MDERSLEALLEKFLQAELQKGTPSNLEKPAEVDEHTYNSSESLSQEEKLEKLLEASLEAELNASNSISSDDKNSGSSSDASGVVNEFEDIYSNSEIMKEIINADNTKSEVFNSTRPFESVVSEPHTLEFMGDKVTYNAFTESIDFGEPFKKGTTDEDTAINFQELQKRITDDIKTRFGGWGRIRGFAVVSGVLIINDTSYEPYLPKEYAQYMPYDLRNAVLAGQFAWLFDFSMLREMKSLVNLKFDDTDFVYSKVRKDLRVVFDFSCAYFFKICKSLLNLQVGTTSMTSGNYKDVEDVFKRPRRSEEIYNACVDLGWTTTKRGWASIGDVFRDPDRSFLSKVWGMSWRGVGTAVAGSTTLTAKLGGLVVNLGKSAVNFANLFKDNF